MQLKLKKKRSTGAKIFYWSMLAFPILQFLIFYVGVNLNTVLLSFKEYNFDLGKFVWEGISSYKMLFSDLKNNVTLWYCFENSLLVYLFTVIIITPFSILFSYYLYKKRLCSGFFKIMLFLPTIIPSIVMVLVYKYFVEGGVTYLMEEWFNKRILGLLYNTKTAVPTIIFFLMLTGFGTGMLLYTGAMARIDKSLIESSQIDGAKPLHELWHIILPSIYPTFTMQMVFGVATFFTSQAALYSFYGAGAAPTNYTFGYWLFIKVVGGDASTYSDYPYASAAGVLFTLIAAPITIGVKVLLERIGPSEG